ncbi:hypothetical protein D3C80_1176140 [compost metagenome]
MKRNYFHRSCYERGGNRLLKELTKLHYKLFRLLLFLHLPDLLLSDQLRTDNLLILKLHPSLNLQMKMSMPKLINLLERHTQASQLLLW